METPKRETELVGDRYKLVVPKEELDKQEDILKGESKKPEVGSEEIMMLDKETERAIDEERKKIKKLTSKDATEEQREENSGDQLISKERDKEEIKTDAVFHGEKIPLLLEQLLADLKPAQERLKIKAKMEQVKVEDIESFCKQNGDDAAFDKMLIHELKEEPVQDIIAICKEDGGKMARVYLKKILLDLGYNVNVLLSKKDGCDYDAATNINGYSIPYWEKVVGALEKTNNNLAIFFGKRFAPGRSRLHIRMFEGKNHTYVISHVDEFNWINTNIKGIKKSHHGSGQGDYINGGKDFLKSLNSYFKEN